VFLDTPNITMGLAVQMDVLMGMGKRSAFVGRGVNDRMLYTIPESLLGRRTLDSKPVPESIKNAYNGLVFDLLDIEPEEDENGKKQPYTLTLSHAAYREWSDFYNAVEKDLGPDGKFETAKGWAGKLPGAAARLAALLHCAENPVKPWSRPVSADTMSRALELAATYSEHALLAFNVMGADADLSGAEKILSWIEKNRFESFTKRECFNAMKSTFKRVAAIDDPLSVLEERNYIRSEVLQTGGRPSVKYTVNPEVIKEW
jgi:putative DNA primase/helicase